MFEEAINAVLAYDAYQHGQKPGNAETVPFKFALSRVRADLVSIYQLAIIGQESSALAVGRIFLEDIELLMAVAASPAFSRDYHSAEPEHEFWRKRIGYGKIYPLVEEFIFRGSTDIDIAKERTQHHKDLKNFLSGYVHPTMSSAMRVVAPPALDTAGLLVDRPMGWFGINSARLCLYLCDEVQMFIVCCINLFIRPDPPPALANHQPDRALAAFFVHAHTLQELVNKYASELQSDYERRAALWEVAAFGQEDET
jgi:hypothetical protein